MAKIGILGGSFNPIHNLHTDLARAALDDYGLDEVRFMIAENPPHKDIEDGCTLEDRIEMVRLAIKDEPRFVIDLSEVDKKEQAYTYSTLTAFKDEHPDDEIFFIMGEDSADNFDAWVRPDIICQKAVILVGQRASRENDTGEKDCTKKNTKNDPAFLNKLKALSERYSGVFLPISSPKTDISSTKIRNLLKKGIPCPEFVQVDVAYYIQKKKIYSYVQ